jgi:5-methylcytosine-specific restriction protein A
MTWGSKSRHERGYGSQWVKLRERVMMRDCYLCQMCMANNFVEQATQVDHIKPKAKGGTDDMNNLQSLCERCHNDKTARDNGGNPKPEIGVDGWPV